jgi:serine/threonine protein kinase
LEKLLVEDGMFLAPALCGRRVPGPDRFHIYYDLGARIQKGSFAVVRKGIRKSDRSEWAVKVVRRDRLSADDEHSLFSEISIMEKLHHPNIVCMKESFDCPRYMYLVMELLTGQQLFERIVSKGRFTEYEALIAFRQIISALSYCHDLGIVHRDIKPENIMSVRPPARPSLIISSLLSSHSLSQILSLGRGLASENY